MDAWMNTVAQGVMVGGLYAMFAIGLTMVFGVMKLVNIAHGDLVVGAAYLALVATQAVGLGALPSLVVVLPAMAIIGYALQRALFNRTLRGGLMPPLLVSFGLSVILQNGLLLIFSADQHRLQAGSLEALSVDLGGSVRIGALPLLQFAVAVAVIGLLQVMLHRTAIGRAFRAVSDEPEIAQLMGLDRRHVFALAMALSLAVAGLAGVFLAMRSNFDPAAGPSRLIFGFEAVIIGGLASFWGTLAGGIVLGVIQALAAAIDPRWQILAGHVVFLAVLAVRPAGLFGRSA